MPLALHTKKELITIFLNSINCLWFEVCLDKENETPEKDCVEWLMIRRHLRVIRDIMVRIEPTDEFDAIKYNDLQGTCEKIMDHWFRLMYPTVLPRVTEVNLWDELYVEVRRLRFLLNDMVFGGAITFATTAATTRVANS